MAIHSIRFCLSMIFSENRYPLFRIMLWRGSEVSSIDYAKCERFTSHCAVVHLIIKSADDVRSPLPDIRRAGKRRRADRAAIGISRGTGAAQADRIRDSPRRSTTK